jgi:HEAT repeat protein
MSQPNAIDAALAGLRSPDTAARSQAVMGLQPGTGDDDRAIAALVEVLCAERDLNVVEDATWVLGRHGAAALPALLTQIAHMDARARHNIVHALGKLADAGAVPALIAATGDAESSVRAKAIVALGQVGDPRALDALIDRLDDAVQEVAWAAREVVAGFSNSAVAPLIAALGTPSVQARELAANLLGDLGDPRAVEPLLAALETPDWPVRFAILEALSNLGDPRALPAAQRLLDDPSPQVGAMAKRVAALLGPQRGH